MTSELLLGEDLSLYLDGTVVGPEAPPAPDPQPAELPYFDARMFGRALEVSADGLLVWNLRPRLPNTDSREAGAVLTVAADGTLVWKAGVAGGRDEVFATDQIEQADRGVLYYAATDPPSPSEGDLWIVTRLVAAGSTETAPSAAPVLTAPATSATTTVAISWTSVARASAYRISVDGVPVQQVATLSATLTLTEGSHTTTVLGLNTAGTGPPSAAKTTVVANQAPGPVTNLRTTNLTPTTVEVAWDYTPPPDFASYVVTASSGTVVVTAKTAVVSGLTAETNVTVSVAARDSGSLSSSAVSVTARTAANPAPTAPATPTGLVVTRTGYSSADFAWNASAGATSYEVSGDGGYNFSSVGTALTFAWGGLAESSGYTLMVRARNAGGASATTQTGVVTLPKVAYWVTNTADRSVGYGYEAFGNAGVTYDASGVYGTTDHWASGGNNHWSTSMDGNLNTGPYAADAGRWIRFSSSWYITNIFWITVWMGYPGTCRWYGWNDSGNVVQQGGVNTTSWPQTIYANELNAPSGNVNRIQIEMRADGYPGVYKLREWAFGARMVTSSTPVYNPP